MLTNKSSGFAVVTALAIIPARASIPSTMLAVIILHYLLFLSLLKDIKTRKKI